MIGSLPKGYSLSWFKVTSLRGLEAALEGGLNGGVGCVAALVGGGRTQSILFKNPSPLGDTAEGQHQFLAHQPSNFSPFHTCCSK